MTVGLVISKTITGSDVADLLVGGSSGYDLGSSNANTTQVPVNSFFISHDGDTAIENLSYYIGLMTGTYGGDYSAAADLAKILAHGDAATGGLQAEETYSATSGTPWFGSPYLVKTGFGDSYANRRLIPTTAMVYNNAGSEVAPTTPVAGSVGPEGNATLGDRAKLRFRYMVPVSEDLGGKRQFDYIFTFNYTT
jgi:hypothetical protein